MGKYIRPFVIFLLLLCIVAGCNGGSGGNTSITKTIGPGGGTITSADGRLTLEIPPGALTEETEITIILLQVPGENDVDLLGYVFLPDGLEFLLPARVTVDVGEITGTPGEGEISFTSLPIIITTEGEEVITLDNLTLELDSDTGSTSLSGDIEHFTVIVIGGKVQLEGDIDGVPFQNPANSPLPVKGQIIVSVTNNLANSVEILFLAYTDSSIAPVIYKGSTNPRFLDPVPLNSQKKTYVIPYECGNPGLGKFKAEIEIIVGNMIIETYTVNEINEAQALLFGLGGQAVQEVEKERIRIVFLNDYTVRGMRDVVCFGPTPPPTLPPTTEPPPTDPPPTEPPPTEPPPTEPPPTEPIKKVGLYESTSGTCGIPSFTLSFTEDGNISLTGFGTNQGNVIFDKTGNPLNFDHPALDLVILGVMGHKCDITCNQDGTQVTLKCSRPGAMCTQTFTHKPN